MPKLVKAQPWQWSDDGSCPDDCRGEEFEERKVKYDHFRPTEPQKVQKKHPKVKADSPALVKAIRAEIQRRTDRLAKERAKYPPTMIKKGKKLVPNPKFTAEMRKKLHRFAFTAEGVRAELIES